MMLSSGLRKPLHPFLQSVYLQQRNRALDEMVRVIVWGLKEVVR